LVKKIIDKFVFWPSKGPRVWAVTKKALAPGLKVILALARGVKKTAGDRGFF
jgi:hypothetical protein